MLTTIKERLKSPAVWAAIIAQIAIIAGILIPDMSEQAKQIGAAVCVIINLFAATNNPADRSNF